MKVRVKELIDIPSHFWYNKAKGEVFNIDEKTHPYEGKYLLTEDEFQKAKSRYEIKPTTIGLVISEEHCDIISDDKAIKENERKIRRFPTGAIRSDNTGRERFDFISPLALKELAQFLSTTENAFAQVNYFLGIPEEACVESALRHINDFRINGEKEEAVALLFNAVALVHTIALKERGEYKEIYHKTELINQSDYKEE